MNYFDVKDIGRGDDTPEAVESGGTRSLAPEQEPLYGCILAGGGGTRLWPLSAQAHPKQFLPLPGPRSMFQETIARLDPLIPVERLYIVTSDAYADTAAQQAPVLKLSQIVAEPSGRGTAASIGLAATLIAARDPQAVMCSFPADHAIGDTAGFRAALRVAWQVARQGSLVTLGVTPSYPETGYGYIRYGAALDQLDQFADRGQPSDSTLYGAHQLRAHVVEQFVEKPQRATAEEYLRVGGYVWNAGIFVWRVDRILEELRRYVPVVGSALDEIGIAARQTHGHMTPEVQAVMRAAWPRLRESVTIDEGVMEPASARGVVTVVPIAVGWNDIGSWSQVATLYPADEAGNVVVGLRAGEPIADVSGEPDLARPDTDCVHIQMRDTLIYSTTGRRISTAGVEGLIIVDTPDGLLICSKEHAQHVKRLAEHDQRRLTRLQTQQSQQPQSATSDEFRDQATTESWQAVVVRLRRHGEDTLSE